MSGHGNGARYEVGDGNWLDRERKRHEATGCLSYFLPYGRRFCEHCQKPKKSDGTKAVKGWMCSECKAKRKAVKA